MAASRIEEIIESIYDYVENCKPTAFSQDKIVVKKDELLDLVGERQPCGLDYYHIWIQIPLDIPESSL